MIYLGEQALFIVIRNGIDMVLKYSIIFSVIFLQSSLDALGDSRPKIVATTGMLADVISNIVGIEAEVEALMGTGVDPHLFKPSRTDIARLASADLVVFNGLHLEGRMLDAIERLKSSGRNVIGVGDLLEEEKLLNPLDSAGSKDPHIWMDPVIWSQCAELIANKLIASYPTKKEAFTVNLREYKQELERLNQYVISTIARIPDNHRVLITAHDAFGYFGKRYGMRVLGIQGISTESESGLREIESLVTIILKEKIPAIFYESTVSEKSITALMEGVNRSGGDVRIGGSLFSDAMGDPNTYKGTYIGMIDYNVTEIGVALGRGVLRTGMNGKL